MKVVKIMLASSIGPSKEYAADILKHSVRILKYKTSTVVFDGHPSSISGLIHYFDDMQIDTAVCANVNSAGKLSTIERIANIREATRKEFLKSDCSHLFFLDADIIPPVACIEKLASHRAAIATGIYPLRDFSQIHLPALTEGKTGKPLFGAPYVQRSVDGFGMGCMLIRRDVLEKTEFRQGADLSKLGEDYGFCVDSGHKVLVDPAVSCWHVHSNGVAGRFAVGKARAGVVWEGSARHATNQFGRWERGVPRYDLSPEKIRQLGPEFVSGRYTPVQVETAMQADLLD
jgi:hypothetical protein